MESVSMRLLGTWLRWGVSSTRGGWPLTTWSRCGIPEGDACLYDDINRVRKLGRTVTTKMVTPKAYPIDRRKRWDVTGFLLLVMLLNYFTIYGGDGTGPNVYKSV